MLSLIRDDRIRLSRLLAVMATLLATLTFVYGCFAPDSFWIGGAIAIVLMGCAVAVWKLGDWWRLRQALRKAQEGMPRPLKQRGFDVLP